MGERERGQIVSEREREEKHRKSKKERDERVCERALNRADKREEYY